MAKLTVKDIVFLRSLLNIHQQNMRGISGSEEGAEFLENIAEKLLAMAKAR